MSGNVNRIPVSMVQGLQEMIDEASVMVKREDIMAYEGQTVFHLENGEYVPNQNRIKVFVGGVPQYSPENFLESSPTTITFHDGLPNFTVVHVEYLQGIAPIVGDITAAFDSHVDPDNEQAHTIDNIQGLRQAIANAAVSLNYVNGDWNTATRTGFWATTNGSESNSPGAGIWYYGTVIKDDDNWIIQEVTDIDTPGGPRYIRFKRAGIWGEWIPLGLSSRLEEVTNIRLNRNKLSWVNPSSSDFLGVYVFGSDEDISTWDIHQCATYATQLADGDVTETIMNPYPHIRLYFKIFCEYEISGVPVFSSGATASSVSGSAFYYEEGNEHDLLTGGWVDGYSLGGGTREKRQDHLYLLGGSDTTALTSYITNSKINFTNVKRLCIDCVRTNTGGAALQVAEYINGDTTDFVAVIPAPTTRGTAYVDVTALTGNYHIRVASANGSALSVYKIWGEY